jgi:hypothetical protein
MKALFGAFCVIWLEFAALQVLWTNQPNIPCDGDDHSKVFGSGKKVPKEKGLRQ